MPGAAPDAGVSPDMYTYSIYINIPVYILNKTREPFIYNFYFFLTSPRHAIPPTMPSLIARADDDVDCYSYHNNNNKNIQNIIFFSIF